MDENENGITRQNKYMIAPARPFPRISPPNQIHHLPLPLIILIPNLLPKRPLGHPQLHLRAQRCEERHKDHIRLIRAENPLRKRPTPQFLRRQQIAEDPVLCAVLFDQWAFWVGWELGFFAGSGERSPEIGVRVAAEPGIVVERPVAVEKAVIEGSGEVCNVYFDMLVCDLGGERE